MGGVGADPGAGGLGLGVVLEAFEAGFEFAEGFAGGGPIFAGAGFIEAEGGGGDFVGGDGLGGAAHFAGVGAEAFAVARGGGGAEVIEAFGGELEEKLHHLTDEGGVGVDEAGGAFGVGG